MEKLIKVFNGKTIDLTKIVIGVILIYMMYDVPALSVRMAVMEGKINIILKRLP